MTIVILISAQHLTQMRITPRNNNMNHSGLAALPHNRVMQILHIMSDKTSIERLALILPLTLEREQNRHAELICAQLGAHTALKTVIVAGVAEGVFDFADGGIRPAHQGLD